MADSGQTEVVGYVLIFSIIVLTIALVTISGEAGLVELRDSQRVANAENGFSALADTVDHLLRSGVPSRATELDLSGESLSLGSPITVRLNGSNDTGVVFERSATIRPLVYRAPNGVTLTYATGAVMIRGNGGGATMLREPRMLLSPNRTMVPIANTSLDREQLRAVHGAIDRESRVLVRTERRSTDVALSTDTVDRLRIEIETPRAEVWESYLETEIDPGSDVCTVRSGTVSCTVTTDRATVVLTSIAVSFE